MIGIKINGKWLDLFPATTLSFELNNPAYLGDDVDVIEGAFSFPADIPLTALNRSILKHPDRLDNAAVFVADAPAEVWAEGSMLFPALATITEAAPGRAKMTLLVSSISKLKETPLDEINLGGIVTMGTNLGTTLAYAKDTAVNPGNYGHVFFPIHNPAVLDDSDPDTETVGNWQNRFDAAAGQFTSAAGDVAMPFLKLNFLLEKIFGHIGFSLKNEFQTDTDRKSVV